MNKKILIIDGHPDSGSLCTALAKRYKNGADSVGSDCELIRLAELDFSPILKYGYRKRTVLEPDLEKTWESISKADHLVFVYPNWWGTYPSLLKGFIDRIFLPGFAFDYQEKSPLPKKLLVGKSARLIVTTDTPNWYYNIVYGRPGHNSMKKNILNFCGIKPVKIKTVGIVKNSNDSKREEWLNKIEQMGTKLS